MNIGILFTQKLKGNFYTFLRLCQTPNTKAINVPKGTSNCIFWQTMFLQKGSSSHLKPGIAYQQFFFVAEIEQLSYFEKYDGYGGMGSYFSGLMISDCLISSSSKIILIYFYFCLISWINLRSSGEVSYSIQQLNTNITIRYFYQIIRIIIRIKMQGEKNVLKLSNSELAQVEAIQKLIIAEFDAKHLHLQSRKQFYTNLPTVARFSIAREFNKPKTIEMWNNWVKWYESFKPEKISGEEEIIKKIHTSGKYRFCGHDKTGCPVLVIRMKYHVKGLATADQNLRYLLYMIQKGVQLAKEAGTYQLSVIYDRREMAESDDVSKESMKKFMPILNDYYPETLKSFYVMGANTLYRAMWKVVSIFISKRTQQKINLLEQAQQIVNFIDKQNLAVEYGGANQLH